MKTVLGRTAAALAILVAVYAIVVRVAQDSWLFTPAVYPNGQWDTQHVYKAQDHWLTASDGTRLHAWLVPAWQPVRTVLFFHGRHGNISDQAEHILKLRDTRSDIFLVDYRGYGRSQGKPTLPGLYLDGEAAYHYVTGTLKVAPSHLVIQGDELGTAVAAHIAADHPQVGGIVLESPFPRLRAWASSLVPFAGWFISGGMDEIGDLKHYPGPKLMMWGTAPDSGVPGMLSMETYAEAPEPKFERIVDGGTDDQLLLQTGRDYLDWMNDFYVRAKLATPGETQSEQQYPVVSVQHRK
jgi:pimeloyl-ACP methyl ester carboxylesterase